MAFELYAHENTDNNEIVKRLEIPDLNCKSEILVNESQEALFYKNGQALDLFISGRHEISIDRLPLLKRIFQSVLHTRGVCPCSIFFVNKVSVLDMVWGTSSAIMLEDPKYHLVINVGANGSMGIRITDTRKFVITVVGQLQDFNCDDVKRAIKGVMMATIKNCIADTIVKEGVSILEIQTRLLELSEKIKRAVNEVINREYGIELVNFYLNTISAPDADIASLKAAKEKYMAAMTDLDIEEAKTIRMGRAMAEARAAQGFTYQDERKFDVMESAAKNEGGASTFMNAGLGIGMGVGLGTGISAAASKTAEVMTDANEMQCPACGKTIKKGGKFCPECGNALPTVKFCTNCGAKLSGSAQFCSECGTKIGG